MRPFSRRSAKSGAAGAGAGNGADRREPKAVHLNGGADAPAENATGGDEKEDEEEDEDSGPRDL